MCGFFYGFGITLLFDRGLIKESQAFFEWFIVLGILSFFLWIAYIVSSREFWPHPPTISALIAGNVVYAIFKLVLLLCPASAKTEIDSR